ncbi:Z-DNA-binding protein 1 [Dendropsophus ebraccatus]|uniref:Z-DNA-binding protein 1 n=1 Tax=Dendropsophus ebraccatus TaxID=150705 RepID=UPI0038317662
MAESRRTRIKADIPSVLTPSEKDIYRHLQHSGPQTALSIAKGLGKKYSRDVNPDLYKMMEKQLLEQKSRVWLIKASGGTENDGATGEENLEDSGVFASDAGNDAKGKANYGCPTETAPAAIHLSGLQKQIYDFLKSNPPSKARTIAMALGMGSAKYVNPDLYRMKQSLFLSHDEKKLWSINTDLNKKSCGSPIPSSEDSAINQSYIEMDSGASSDDKDFRRDSGIGEMGPSPNNTMRDEPNPTGPLPGEIRLQYGQPFCISL